MNYRNLLIAVFVVAIPVAFLMLVAADHGSTGDGQMALSPSIITNGQAESVSKPVKLAADSTVAIEGAEPRALSEQDGTTLLQTHCAECHSVRLLEKTRKSRSEWERTLSRMERYIGRLSDIERLVVLDHLATPEEP